MLIHPFLPFSLSCWLTSGILHVHPAQIREKNTGRRSKPGKVLFASTVGLYHSDTHQVRSWWSNTSLRKTHKILHKPLHLSFWHEVRNKLHEVQWRKLDTEQKHTAWLAKRSHSVCEIIITLQRKQLHDLLILPSAFDNLFQETESNLCKAKATSDNHQTIA